MMIDIYVNFISQEVLNEKQFEEEVERTISLYEADMDRLNEWLDGNYTCAQILHFSESEKIELLKEWKHNAHFC